MADAANKYPENVEGKFYVDDQCIDCDLCRETAPANFTRNDDGGHSYVHKQPTTPEEDVPRASNCLNTVNSTKAITNQTAILENH